MLKRLHLRNFTVFEDAEFVFDKRLSVIVGANGMGKSHVLKVGYAVDSAYASASQPGESEFPLKLGLAAISRLGNGYDEVIDRDLGGQFPANTLNKLVRRPKLSTASVPVEAEVEAFLKGSNGSLAFTIDSVEANKISMQNIPAIEQPGAEPIFIPAKEVLTLGWLLGYNLYSGSTATDAERTALPVDKTYIDLLKQLSKPPLPSLEPGVASTLEVVRQIIGGEVEAEKGHFYLVPFNQNRMGMNMVAEGMRKFATLYKLLANGTLTPETTLFWDEPEANLNPALLKEMATVLAELARAGFQIILATHSLFLLKELHILSRQGKLPVRYFGLSAQPGEATTVATADNLELLPNIVALDAELEQSDRFQRVLDQEDTNRN